MEKTFICNAESPVVSTAGGKLRGMYYDGVYRFAGIRYAKAKRFQMPEPVEPWEGIRDALDYGCNCPPLSLPRTAPHGEILGEHRFWPESEHCQYLNVWTDSLDRDAKKPVLVWLHGGGYVDGSAIEQSVYDGRNLAKKKGVVMVSVNHRLNVLGHLDMSDFGPEYENSGNAGFADLVAALQWVRENIEAFGGDPDCVTIFGQSGGGGKVSALLQIPSAEGLFQRAVVMSGIITDDNILVNTTAEPKHIVEVLMDEMGLRPDELDRFLTAPEIILSRAAGRAQARIVREGYAIGWGPKNNGWYQGSLCLNELTPYSSKIPTLVGTAYAEFNPVLNTENKAEMPEEKRRKLGGAMYGEKGEEYLRIFEKAYPHMNKVYAGLKDTFFRRDTMDYVLKKAGLSEAPVYNYIFAAESTYNGGTVAGHGADLPFAFCNTELAPAWQIPGVSDRLEEQFSDMLVAFAKTGDPNVPSLPLWKPCTGEHIETMIFDRVCGTGRDHDKELVDYILKNAPKFDLQIVHEVPAGEKWIY